MTDIADLIQMDHYQVNKTNIARKNERRMSRFEIYEDHHHHHHNHHHHHSSRPKKLHETKYTELANSKSFDTIDQSIINEKMDAN